MLPGGQNVKISTGNSTSRTVGAMRGGEHYFPPPRWMKIGTLLLVRYLHNLELWIFVQDSLPANWGCCVKPLLSLLGDLVRFFTPSPRGTSSSSASSFFLNLHVQRKILHDDPSILRSYRMGGNQ